MLARIVRHERYLVAAALTAITLAAWIYILWLAGGMYSPDMSSGPDWMHAMMRSPAAPWSPVDFLFVLLMWVIMMIGMMLPATTPVILLYHRVGQQATRQGKHFAATAWFVSGYLLTWVIFSIIATLAQWGLSRAALLTPMMAISDSTVRAALLILAGIYQWSPLKHSCLSQCQFPLAFIQSHGGFRAEAPGALWIGMLHGGYCLGCCWALMALLFAAGVMNPLWIAGLAVLVLLEKLGSLRGILPKMSGMLFILAGLWMLLLS